jgi:hypothetical protein
MCHLRIFLNSHASTIAFTQLVFRFGIFLLGRGPKPARCRDWVDFASAAPKITLRRISLSDGIAARGRR